MTDSVFRMDNFCMNFRIICPWIVYRRETQMVFTSKYWADINILVDINNSSKMLFHPEELFPRQQSHFPLMEWGDAIFYMSWDFLTTLSLCFISTATDKSSSIINSVNADTWFIIEYHVIQSYVLDIRFCVAQCNLTSFVLGSRFRNRLAFLHKKRILFSRSLVILSENLTPASILRIIFVCLEIFFCFPDLLLCVLYRDSLLYSLVDRHVFPLEPCHFIYT